MPKYTVLEGSPEEVLGEVMSLPEPLRGEVLMGLMAAVVSHIVDLSRLSGKPDEWTCERLNESFVEASRAAGDVPFPIHAEVRNGDIDFGYTDPESGEVTWMSDLPDEDDFSASGPVFHL